jgi:HSP20 family protein
MSLIKFNKKRVPWMNQTMPSWFDTEDFFAEDLFLHERNFPAMNVKENKNNFEIELAVPGFTKEDIEVALEDDVLHVCAKKSTENVEDIKDYTRREFSFNEFDRKFQLPTNINQSKKVKAIYKDGILKLNLAKLEGVKFPPKKVIEIV